MKAEVHLYNCQLFISISFKTKGLHIKCVFLLLTPPIIEQ